MTQHNDIVNHPAHYTSCKSGIECIDIAECLPFCLGNAYKYMHRAGLKGDALTDYQKARFYFARASLNNEKLNFRALALIERVIEFRDGAVKDILSALCENRIFRPDYDRVLSLLDELIERIEHDNSYSDTNMDNRPT